MKKDKFLNSAFNAIFSPSSDSIKKLEAYFTIFNENKSAVMSMHHFYHDKIQKNPAYSHTHKSIAKIIGQNLYNIWNKSALNSRDLAIIKQYLPSLTVKQRQIINNKNKDSKIKKFHLNNALIQYGINKPDKLYQYIDTTKFIGSVDAKKIISHMTKKYTNSHTIELIIKLNQKINKKNILFIPFDLALNLMTEDTDLFSRLYQSFENKVEKKELELELAYTFLRYSVDDTKKTILTTMINEIIFNLSDTRALDFVLCPLSDEKKFNLMKNTDYIFNSHFPYANKYKKLIALPDDMALNLLNICSTIKNNIPKSYCYALDNTDVESTLIYINSHLLRDKMENELKFKPQSSKVIKI